MSEPFIGEIRMFAGNFNPRGWAACDGQLLAVSQHDALFSLIGTIYGGDGRTTFALPDLRGRVPVHYGSGPGLAPIVIGRKAGQEQVALTASQAGHTHVLNASTDDAGDISPADNVPAIPTGVNMYNAGATGVAMRSDAIQPTTGGGQPHDNVMPFLCITFIISLVGIYPSRS